MPTLAQTMHARGTHKPKKAVAYAVMDVTALQLQVTDRNMQEWHLLAATVRIVTSIAAQCIDTM